MRHPPPSSVASVLVVLLCLVGVAGCSQTATVYRYGAPSLEAEVVGSDVEMLLVTDQSGEVYEVPVQTVTDIDHPGNVTAAVGAYLVFTGVVMLAIGPDGEADSVDDIIRKMGWGYTALGGWLGAWGLGSWIDSKLDAAEAEKQIGKRFVPGIEHPVRRSSQVPD